MKLSQRPKEEHAFLQQVFRSRSICDRCGATLQTYSEACTAELSEPCPGFMAIEEARQEFKERT